jgi:hypothetical protein
MMYKSAIASMSLGVSRLVWPLDIADSYSAVPPVMDCLLNSKLQRTQVLRVLKCVSFAILTLFASTDMLPLMLAR